MQFEFLSRIEKLPLFHPGPGSGGIAATGLTR
jgi:hypothetical protein